MEKILVPVDGSELAKKALLLATDLAEKIKAEIEIMHVIQSLPATITGTVNPLWVDEYTEDIKKKGLKLLSEALMISKSNAGDLKMTTKLITGQPSDVIVEESEKGNFDLIVMGSRGLGGITDYILGRVSNQVAHETKIPILVVK